MVTEVGYRRIESIMVFSFSFFMLGLLPIPMNFIGPRSNRKKNVHLFKPKGFFLHSGSILIKIYYAI